jgi:glycosyltransferase involved in cell wall biosynthesis
MQQPLVSIIIDNYNYGRYIKAAIDSALEQTYLNTEIIVVDDGSTDDSQEIIKSYKEKIKPVLKSNGGQASAFNAGFMESHGDIICFLDADDMYLPSKVAEVVKAFTKLKDVDWVFHPLLSVKTDELEKENFNPFVNSESEVTYVEIDFGNQIRAGKQPAFVPETSALSFSRKILEEVFPIPQDQRVYIGVDTYAAIACVSLSKGCIIDESLSVYRLHDSNEYSSLQIDKLRETSARLRIVTGYWLRTDLPTLSKYTNIIFSKGLACFWLTKNSDGRYSKFIKDYFSYLSIPEKILVFLRASYYFQKTFLCKTLP